MKTLLRLLLKTHHQRNRSGPAQTDKGMTLVELLVGAIMAFLIITPMLGFVVDMLNTDRREQVKSNTEQDVQAALDFIAQDLSQAIYIYDNAGITAINSSPTPLPSPPNATPILVFWKRKQIINAVSVDTNPANRVLPTNCTQNTCNDTYTRSLVAYYQVRENNPNSIWCQPSGAPCPRRIERYEISEGIMENPAGTTAATRYFDDNEAKDGQRHSAAFNLNFDWNRPTENVTNPAGFAGLNPQVLVNYIDQSALVPPPPTDECQKALGNPTAQVPGTTTTSPVSETTLKISNPDNTNSFYACVDTSQNIARITIRGNTLRRLQTNDTAYNPNRSAFFPTASVQVQGLGSRGR
ncbi:MULTISPECIES: hormogonium polysaccharide secretion pseudopilin HpsC [unclassified Microcoleus]|uniref:hormogonium polysaccharide secretion pseudopilin HpsC n=1 Tax=unclassified Microcoleus TaxID=2642155 RepID=UPI002FD743FA